MATLRVSMTSPEVSMDVEDENRPRASVRHQLAHDKGSLLLLLFLYMLQGIPLGLAGSVPMLLQAKHIGYRQQAMFSLVSWPFSVKLLWAPIVDSVFSSTFGRRKTWLVPTQYALGVTMILLSFIVDTLMGEGGVPPNVLFLTVLFFFLHFLAATQDIAVDGWALTMLSRENVGYASTCNSVGQTAGFFLGYTVFLALGSADFCNAYLRLLPQETGILDLPTFLFFWGIVFIVMTTGIWWLKKESSTEQMATTPVVSGYLKLLSCLKLSSVQELALAVLTSKMAFAAADAVTGLKLIEAGLPKEKIALLALPLVPLQILLPLIISRATSGPRPLSIFLRAYPLRLAMGMVFAAIVSWTASLGVGGEFPTYYYVVILLCFALHQIATYSMFVSLMAFHARISDPTIGGTYMTLLNTVTNLAGTWPNTLALWFVDVVSIKDCEGVSDFSLDCDTMQELEACQAAGGHCVTHLDGYFVESIVCVFLGVLWVWWQRRRLARLQTLDQSMWKTS